MLCEKCKQRPATFHYTEIKNNVKKEMHLCEVCAQEEQLAPAHLFKTQLDFPNFLAGMINPGPQTTGKVVQQDRRCPGCGLTARELNQSGLFGCSECYREFEPHLERFLRRVHGASRHTGKIPARGHQNSRIQREIAQLKTQLHEAVTREEYEQAAALRDRIRELEAGLAAAGGDRDGDSGNNQ